MTNIKRTISKAYQQLSNFDRVRIETLLNQGFSQARIARELNRSRSTISREITRGSVLQRIPGHKVALIYFADTAAYLHAQRRERCRPKTMLEKNPEFYAACAAAIKQRPRVHSVDVASCTPSNGNTQTRLFLQHQRFTGILRPVDSNYGPTTYRANPACELNEAIPIPAPAPIRRSLVPRLMKDPLKFKTVDKGAIGKEIQ